MAKDSVQIELIEKSASEKAAAMARFCEPASQLAKAMNIKTYEAVVLFQQATDYELDALNANLLGIATKVRALQGLCKEEITRRVSAAIR